NRWQRKRPRRVGEEANPPGSKPRKDRGNPAARGDLAAGSTPKNHAKRDLLRCELVLVETRGRYQLPLLVYGNVDILRSPMLLGVANADPRHPVTEITSASATFYRSPARSQLKRERYQGVRRLVRDDERTAPGTGRTPGGTTAGAATNQSCTRHTILYRPPRGRPGGRAHSRPLRPDPDRPQQSAGAGTGPEKPSHRT